MRKLFGILFAIIMVLSIAVPAMAADVNTGVTVVGGGAGQPLVKAKWEASANVSSETGDPSHQIPFTQILPPGSFQGTVPIVFYAVITDAALGVNNIRDVWADVFHPLGPPLEGSFKFQVQMFPMTALTGAQALATFNEAYAANLVTTNGAVTLAEIRDELNQKEAWLFRGEYFMYYCQPWGDYRVKVKAYDKQNDLGILENLFTYVKVTAAEFDFNGLNYGAVQVGIRKVIGGDTTFNSPVDVAPSPNPATVRNIGNTNLKVRVKQDDMGFGQTVAQTPPWNVRYDARLGAAGTTVNYLPAWVKGEAVPEDAWTVIPDTLRMCNTEKLDFSILITKADPSTDPYTGKMVLGAKFEAFTDDFTPPAPPTSPNPS